MARARAGPALRRLRVAVAMVHPGSRRVLGRALGLFRDPRERAAGACARPTADAWRAMVPRSPAQLRGERAQPRAPRTRSAALRERASAAHEPLVGRARCAGTATGERAATAR